MSKTNPPFRADQVGSFLRPQELLDARAKHVNGDITSEELREVEDKAIREVIKKQEEMGLKSVTDGEFRRTYFHLDFLEKLGGVTITGGIGVKFHSKKGEVDFAPPKLTISGKLETLKTSRKRIMNSCVLLPARRRRSRFPRRR